MAHHALIALVLALTATSAAADLIPCAQPGAPWKADPKGTSTTLGGLNTYVAGSPGNRESAAIIFISDVFGWTAPVNRVAADFIAKRSGIPVFIPDFFEGDRLTNFSQIGEFLSRHGPTQTIPLLDNVIAALNQRYGKNVKLGAIGFCWGGRYSLIAGTNDRTDATANCHPSLVNVTADGLANTTAPALFLLAQGDFLFPNTTQAQTFEAIQNSGTPYLVKEFPAVAHGFCVRCAEGDDVCEKARYEALSIASTWFMIILRSGFAGTILKTIQYMKNLFGL